MTDRGGMQQMKEERRANSNEALIQRGGNVWGSTSSGEGMDRQRDELSGDKMEKWEEGMTDEREAKQERGKESGI